MIVIYTAIMHAKDGTYGLYDIKLDVRTAFCCVYMKQLFREKICRPSLVSGTPSLQCRFYTPYSSSCDDSDYYTEYRIGYCPFCGENIEFNESGRIKMVPKIRTREVTEQVWEEETA